jgi:formate hydrogenlyase subunit 6/NADH:ubiquinone oxidoreductase subunit I
MSIGTMFKDVVRSAFRRPATRLYPVERVQPPERYRGKLSFAPQACTGCALCVKDCPSDAIELTILDRAAKRYVMKYHIDRCTYCGQCVVSCKFKCVALSSAEWELAALKRDGFTVYYGNPEDVEQHLAGQAPRVAPPARS